MSFKIVKKRDKIKKALVIGDSNTWGYDPRSYFGGKYKKTWVDCLNVQGWKFESNGINGRCLHDILDMKVYEPYDFIWICLGTNDILQYRKIENIIEDMKIILTHFENAGILCPPVIEIVEFKQKSIELNQEYMKLKVPCIPYEKAELCFDGIHFSESGHKQFASNINKILNKKL